ncbi:glycosyltransferase [Lactobacillus delbrueckii]|uniref:glycosyltransferase n=1 Tax=Lactobacillus delbrueckii TaxID=1584 RepID=UPI001F191940|nr:glycosyltransferase [Lactobacillus delbrueckii]GHN60463.1 glycosyltransferase [Lactobacillus delbrueckii]
MKVMFLLCTDEYSGAENISLIIADNLIRRGFDVVYCSPKGKIQEYIRKNFPSVNYRPLNKFSLVEIRKALRSEKPDLVHAVDFRVSMFMSVEGYPYVVHLHNNPYWIRKKNIFTLALLRTLNKSRGNIYVSQSIADEFVFQNKVKARTEVIENIVEKNRVLNLAEQKVSDKFDIGFFGRITEQKDPLRFLELILKIQKQKPDLKAVMVGKSDGSLDNEVISFIKSHSLNVQLVGFQNNPYKYMKSCKIVLMPSKWEGFGLTAVEAMIFGKPVLSTSVGGLKDVQKETGNICENDFEFVSKAMELLTEEKTYQQQSKIVQKAVERFTDVDKYVDRIISVYGKL